MAHPLQDLQSAVFGYPGLAIILFLLAVFCGFALVLSILFNDDWRVWRNKPPR